jgi:hypothetical protein
MLNFVDLLIHVNVGAKADAILVTFLQHPPSRAELFKRYLDNQPFFYYNFSEGWGYF